MWQLPEMRRIAAVAVVLSALCADALDNGVAVVPPMGYNTWNYYGCSSEEAPSDRRDRRRRGAAAA